MATCTTPAMPTGALPWGIYLEVLADRVEAEVERHGLRVAPAYELVDGSSRTLVPRGIDLDIVRSGLIDIAPSCSPDAFAAWFVAVASDRLEDARQAGARVVALWWDLDWIEDDGSLGRVIVERVG